MKMDRNIGINQMSWEAFVGECSIGRVMLQAAGNEILDGSLQL